MYPGSGTFSKISSGVRWFFVELCPSDVYDTDGPLFKLSLWICPAIIGAGQPRHVDVHCLLKAAPHVVGTAELLTFQVDLV